MQFTSLTFAAFLLCVIALHALTKRRSAQNGLLLVASYVFYGWWDWRFLSLIAISTGIDFVVSARIHATRDPLVRRRWLQLSLATNLGLLGFFKYFDFFAQSLADALAQLGLSVHAFTLDVVLPVGISFYTFQTLSYTLDVYRGRLEPERSLLTFAVFVAFFPQLVAGPIERAAHMLPQFQQAHRLRAAAWREGISYILLGLFTKLVLGDNAAAIANRAFAVDAPNLGTTLVGTYAFAIQILGDFSGYSSIAIGLGRILGVRISANFRQPYLSASFQEFWRRWHISLSSWLRDYLYIPLGGNRMGTVLTYRNLFLTMLLGGLWHGAAWTFVVWGALHGLFLVVERLGIGRRGDAPGGAGAWLARVGVFHGVCLAWVFFRAESFGHAAAMLGGLARPGLGSAYDAAMLVPLAGLTLALDLWRERSGEPVPFARWSPVALGTVWAGLALSIAIARGSPQTFIYFQF